MQHHLSDLCPCSKQEFEKKGCAIVNGGWVLGKFGACCTEFGLPKVLCTPLCTVSWESYNILMHSEGSAFGKMIRVVSMQLSKCAFDHQNCQEYADHLHLHPGPTNPTKSLRWSENTQIIKKIKNWNCSVHTTSVSECISLYSCLCVFCAE